MPARELETVFKELVEGLDDHGVNHGCQACEALVIEAKSLLPLPKPDTDAQAAIEARLEEYRNLIVALESGNAHLKEVLKRAHPFVGWGSVPDEVMAAIEKALA